MKENRTIEEEILLPNEHLPHVKDRRRFLKKLAGCALAVPVITVLPPMAAACESGYSSEPPHWDDDKGRHKHHKK